MNYAVATIVNANGSMAELPKSTVYMLEDNFSIQDLTNALDTLWQDKHLRINLSKNARNFIVENHNSQECAEKYYNSIENFYNSYRNLDYIINEIALLCTNSNTDINEEEKIKIISCNLALNFPGAKPNNQIFIDISDLVYNRHSSEAQSFLKHQLNYLFDNTPKNYRIEPIYFDTSNQIYKYARNFTLQFLHINSELNKFLLDEIIEYENGNIFLIDNEYINNMTQNHKNIYSLLYNQGVEFMDIDKFLNL